MLIEASSALSSRPSAAVDRARAGAPPGGCSLQDYLSGRAWLAHGLCGRLHETGQSAGFVVMAIVDEQIPSLSYITELDLDRDPPAGPFECERGDCGDVEAARGRCVVEGFDAEVGLRI